MLDEHYGDKTESNLERRFLRLLRTAGVALPEQQVQAFDDDGFIMRIDFAYPRCKIAIELDSVLHHGTNKAFEDDPIKRNRLALAGWLVLAFTSKRIRTRPTRVCEDVARAVRDRTSEPSELSSAIPVRPVPRTKER